LGTSLKEFASGTNLHGVPSRFCFFLEGTEGVLAVASEEELTDSASLPSAAVACTIKIPSSNNSSSLSEKENDF